jgi:hypothetical protein
MNTDVKKVPFTIEFDGQIIEHEGACLYCRKKNVYASVSVLRDAMRNIGKKPIGTKILVGKQIRGDEWLYMWRDEHRTHLGCLSEPTVEFNKKFIEFIKHLNNK